MPADVLEVACSWVMTPKEIAAELYAGEYEVHSAVVSLRSRGFIDRTNRKIWGQPVIPTAAGWALQRGYDAE
jgi:hypothetical protein